MIAMLNNIARGQSPTFRLTGRSAFGGATWTLRALHVHGLLDADGQLTVSGQRAIGADPLAQQIPNNNTA